MSAKLDEMWAALEAYQDQADADEHGESWRAACKARTVEALDIADDDIGRRMKEADPEWGLFSDRRPNDDYERLHVAGEALCSAAGALSAVTDGMIQKNAKAAVRLVAQALGEDEED